MGRRLLDKNHPSIFPLKFTYDDCGIKVSQTYRQALNMFLYWAMNFVFLLYSTNFFVYMILLGLKPYVKTDTIIFSGILEGQDRIGTGVQDWHSRSWLR
jgi:hypothetical protein